MTSEGSRPTGGAPRCVRRLGRRIPPLPTAPALRSPSGAPLGRGLTIMTRRNVLGVALAATIVVGGCSAATVPSAAPLSQAAAAAAPSVAPPSHAPTVAAPSVAPQSLAPADSPVGTIHLSLHPIN